MLAPSPLYRAAVRLGVALAPVAGLVNGKVRQGRRGRSGAIARMRAWAGAGRDHDRPLAWFHAPSVGEGLQAASVLAALRRRRPDCQLVYTFFSPSAEKFARRLDVDFAEYLPFDRPGDVELMLDALRPDLLVFTKLDLWPELACRAAAGGTAVSMVAGTVRPGSGRLGWLARTLLRAGYEAVNLAAAISEDDGRRLARLGVRPERIVVAGDPRFDSVLERVSAVPVDDPLLAYGAGAPTLVAGSTWPEDERVLLDAFARLHVHRPDARLIVVPHEPTAEHLAGMEREARRLGLPAPVRLSTATGPVPLLLVDRVGVLASLYGAGTMAYVGGGFGSAGLHSVLEPAAWGLPVVVGPRWQESRDASLLLEAGAAEALLELGVAETGESLQALWEDWISNEPRRRAQGRRAREMVLAGTGAAERSAELLDQLLAARPLRASPSPLVRR